VTVPKTAFDKLWEAHRVGGVGEGVGAVDDGGDGAGVDEPS